jgi:outer membrane receptor for Fe3+-dicitrate
MEVPTNPTRESAFVWICGSFLISANEIRVSREDFFGSVLKRTGRATVEQLDSHACGNFASYQNAIEIAASLVKHMGIDVSWFFALTRKVSTTLARAHTQTLTHALSVTNVQNVSLYVRAYVNIRVCVWSVA